MRTYFQQCASFQIYRWKLLLGSLLFFITCSINPLHSKDDNCNTIENCIAQQIDFSSLSPTGLKVHLRGRPYPNAIEIYRANEFAVVELPHDTVVVGFPLRVIVGPDDSSNSLSCVVWYGKNMNNVLALVWGKLDNQPLSVLIPLPESWKDKTINSVNVDWVTSRVARLTVNNEIDNPLIIKMDPANKGKDATLEKFESNMWVKYDRTLKKW
jgi:hypothetical protein